MRMRTTLPVPGGQTPLFQDPPACTAKGCQAGTRKNLCGHDADIAAGVRDPYARRPRGCLNTAQNRDGIPYA